MANIPLKSIKFPDLADTYTVPSDAGELPYDKSATYPADTVGKALQDKPDADGTIANAEQLTSNIYEEDNTPYNFRTSGGSIDIGDRETDMLVGGSVVWNQLQTARDSAYTARGITISATAGDGSNSITGTRESSGWLGIVAAGVTLPANHVALICANNMKGDLPTVAVLRQYTQVAFLTPSRSAILFKYTEEQTVNISLGGAVDDVWNGSLIPQIFDLTQMFGSTIADYIYSLEQATAGAGVAFFRKLFPKPYYAYNAGELMSVQTSSHDMVGFNQWDGSFDDGYLVNATTGELVSNNNYYASDYVKVVPNMDYYFNVDVLSVNSGTQGMAWYDADKNYISGIPFNSTFNATKVATSPSNAKYVRWCANKSGRATECINLHWDGERDGEYEAYDKHSYSLDSSLTLRGIPKLDNGNLYYDGDSYESDGTVNRRYGTQTIVGTETINVNETTAYRYFTVVGAVQTNAWETNVFSNRFQANASGATGRRVQYDGSKYLRIIVELSDAITTVEQMKSFLVSNNLEVIYPLATPTTEEADAYTNPQIVNDFGTEEYVDYAVSQGTRDVAIPVGHETQYMANLKAKLEMSPNSPEGAGDYIVRQTNGENEYVTLAANATIQNIIARLEALENAES